MQIDLNIEHNEVYERGAALLTVLACAKEVGDERSLQLYLSLCGKALWLRHLENPDDWTPVTVKPQYMFRDRKVIDRDVAYVAKQLGQRTMSAGSEFEHEHQFVLRTVEAAHTGVWLCPDAKVEQIQGCRPSGWEQLGHMPPVHADEGWAGGLQ